MILLILITIIIISIFAMTFADMIKKNSSSFVYILLMEFIGILIDFVAILRGKVPNIFEYVLIFLFSIIIPVIIFALDKKDGNVNETLEILLIKLKKGEEKEKLLSIIEKNPNSYLAHKKLADYYAQNSEKEKAEDEYIKTIQIKQDDYKTYCKLAKILHENKKEEQAIETLQTLIKIKPDYYEGSMLLGKILYDNEKFKEAISVYNQALQYNPSEYDIYYNLGMTYTRLNDFQSATEYYKKAATINSYKDIANLNLGQINLIFKDYEKAEQYFYETIKSDDDKISSNAYYYLAKIRIIQGNEEQAIQYAKLAIDMYPPILKKIRLDDIFISILGKVDPKAIEDKTIDKNEKEEGKLNKEAKSKITDKDEEIIEYLGKTFNVVKTLNNDFKGMKKNESKEIKI